MNLARPTGISIRPDLLAAGRARARLEGRSFSNFVCGLLAREIGMDVNAPTVTTHDQQTRQGHRQRRR